MWGGWWSGRGEDDRARGQRAGGASEGAGGFMDIYKIITIKEGTECKQTKTNSPRNDSSSGDHLNISINGATAATTTVVAMAVAVADVRQSTTATATHLISCDSMNSLEIVSN